MKKVNSTGVWVEDYRPTKISDTILPARLKEPFQKMVDKGEIQNLLLEGPPGCGKTTAAKALCLELGAEYIVINGSDESGIDVLRTKVRTFASNRSMLSEAKHKVVIFDEADYLNAMSTQPALRNFIEEFAPTCRFIFTCNYVSRIIEPLHSRLTLVPFRFSSEEIKQMAVEFYTRACEILKNEGITFSKESVAGLVRKFFPDFRRVLNELQAYSNRSGGIDSAILSNLGGQKIESLFQFMKAKDFKAIRQFFEDNSDLSPAELFEGMFRGIRDALEPSSIPGAVLILANYQYKSAFVANQTINGVACCVELMIESKFK